jgi:hypothetical protein
MKKVTVMMVSFIVFFSTLAAWGMGDDRMRIKVDRKKLSAGAMYAVIGFNGGSVVTGNMGLGSLITGAMANKSESGKTTLDEAYLNNLYDSMIGTLTNEGYAFVNPEKVASSPTYKTATEVNLPSSKNAKGLKVINTNKTADVKAIASEVGADRLFFITVGHSLGMRSNIGTIAGKQVGIAQVMITVFDAEGKKLGFIIIKLPGARNSKIIKIYIAG